MTTNFPTSLDSLTNPTGANDLDDAVGGRTHSQQHADLNDAVEALQAKVGATDSAVVGSIDKRLSDRPLIWFPQGSLAVRTSRSFGWKGCIYTPSYNQSLWGIQVAMQAPAASQTFQAAVITVSAGAVATITKTDVLTFPATTPGGSPLVHFKFASPVAVTSGTAYGLVFGYSSTAGSATSTSDLTVFTTQIAVWEMAIPRAGTLSSSVYHIATTNPAVATSVTTAANDQGSGGLTYSVAPILERA